MQILIASSCIPAQKSNILEYFKCIKNCFVHLIIKLKSLLLGFHMKIIPKYYGRSHSFIEKPTTLLVWKNLENDIFQTISKLF